MQWAHVTISNVMKLYFATLRVFHAPVQTWTCLSDKSEQLIDSHFQAGYCGSDNRENNQHQCDDRKIVRPVRFVMMDQCHFFPPKADSATRLVKKSCADLGHPARAKSCLVSAF
jgi:hypothetical protein